MLGIVPVVADKYKLEEIQTDEGIKLFVFNETDGTRTLAETFDPVATGALVKFRITNSDGTVTEAVELLNSKAGKELQKKVNAAKKIDPQSASIVKVGTEQVNPQAYLTIDGEVVTSFDNRTFFNPKTNKVMSLSDPSVQAQALGDADVYEIIKNKIFLIMVKTVRRTYERFKYFYLHRSGWSAFRPRSTRRFKELERTTLKAIYGEITEQDVKRGTGLISNIFAAANAVGGTFAPEFFSKVFKNTEQARLNLGLFNLMAVSALAVNPRLAVYDIQRVEKYYLNLQDCLQTLLLKRKCSKN